MNRLVLAMRAFWNVLTRRDAAARVEAALAPTVGGPDLRVLALFQREGRLLDFFLENLDALPDAQIGAVVRDIHKGCNQVLRDHLTVVPVIDAPEESRVRVPSDFDPAAIRLVGRVVGAPPFEGVLKHHGWRAIEASLPALPGARDGAVVLAPAEVEVA